MKATLSPPSGDLRLPWEQSSGEALHIYARLFVRFSKVAAIAAVVCFLPFLVSIWVSRHGSVLQLATPATFALSILLFLSTLWYFRLSQLTFAAAVSEATRLGIAKRLASEQAGALIGRETLAEALLECISPGVIAADEKAIIRWINPAAQQILGFSADEVLGRPVEAIDGRLCSLLRETLDGKSLLNPQHWIDLRTRRSVSVEARRLVQEGKNFGAVAVINDLTADENLRQKQDLIDHAAFWTDLAASMSHEVRNPLVAIKTFAMLLPERFDDPDFRRDFKEIVVQEIDRLDKIITQINHFAHPAELIMKPIDVRSSVKKAIEIARGRVAEDALTVDMTLPSDLPKVLGDETALTEAFAHLVANAAEATSNLYKPRITLAARPFMEGNRPSGVIVTVKDNGRGISPDLKNNVFSPFCTTKARGMGLGLPIVRRTVFDHNGRVDIDSDREGTSISVILPGLEETRTRN